MVGVEPKVVIVSNFALAGNTVVRTGTLEAQTNSVMHNTRKIPNGFSRYNILTFSNKK